MLAFLQYHALTSVIEFICKILQVVNFIVTYIIWEREQTRLETSYIKETGNRRVTLQTQLCHHITNETPLVILNKNYFICGTRCSPIVL